MKSKVVVEFQGVNTVIKDIEDKAKEIWKTNGGKIKDIKTLDIYFKPDEKMCYYVINEKETGNFPV